MEKIINDGGRSGAGYKGSANDCVARAIAIATNLPYQQVYDKINSYAKRGGRSSARNGVMKDVYKRLLAELGWTWFPTMQIGQGCKVHLRAEELPKGRLIVRVSRHLVAVIDGQIHDTHDPSRGGTRCVYGYWKKQP